MPIYHTLAKLGLGAIVISPDKKNGGRARIFWEEAKRRGVHLIEFRPFGRSVEFFVARYGKTLYAYTGLPRPYNLPQTGLDWMDNKGLMRDKFTKAGLPVAHGGVCASRKCLREQFDRLEKPVIVKPSTGSRSRHTTIHISNLEQLDDAIRVGKQLSPWLVVEEELEGMVHRVTLIGGKMIGVLRREPPHVIGDGSSTVRELFDRENQNPRRDGKVFHKLVAGLEAEDELKLQGLTWHSVPKNKQMVLLHQKISRSNGASNTDVTDLVHPDNKKLFEKVAQVVDDQLIGVDFIISDIGSPWHEQLKCGVIECNSLPFIDLHHYPLDGKPRDAAGALMDLVFPESKHK